MGSIEFLSDIHEKKMNAKLVGRSGNAHGNNYTIYLNGEREVKSMEDFKGLKIRGTATYAPLLEELGADVISMPGEEIYSALEKGIIDGFTWASYSVLDLGVEDLIAYQVLPLSSIWQTN
ncbi:Solute-binding protein [Ureibacillus acetophenoni]